MVGQDFRVAEAAAEAEASECKYYFQGSRGCLSSALSSSADITANPSRADPLSLPPPSELDDNENRNLESTSTATKRWRPLKVTLTPPLLAPSPPTTQYPPPCPDRPCSSPQSTQ